MKTFLLIAAAAVLVQVATPAVAAPVWSGALTVDQIEGDTNMIAYFTEATPNPAGCSQGVLKPVAWEAANAAAKNFMAMLLVAKTTGRSVKVLVDDSACLWGGWPKLVSVKLL